jgi:TnsA endonuclease N terminal
MTPKSTPFSAIASPITSLRNTPQGFTHAGGNKQELQEYLRPLLGRTPPSPTLAPEPAPVQRVWMPQAGCPSGWVRVLARHPALERVFQDVPAFKVPPSSRARGWGRQNRLPSLKGDRIMRAASNPEMDNLLECEVDPTVEAFCEQPIRIQYKHLGVRRSYTPDLLIFHRTPPHEFREIKHERKAAVPENEMRWPAIGEALNSLGFSFQVYTERHLRIRKATVRTIFRNNGSRNVGGQRYRLQADIQPAFVKEAPLLGNVGGAKFRPFGITDDQLRCRLCPASSQRRHDDGAGSQRAEPQDMTPRGNKSTPQIFHFIPPICCSLPR